MAKTRSTGESTTIGLQLDEKDLAILRVLQQNARAR